MKLCECGCGQPTNIAPASHEKYGHIKGQPYRYLKGHRNRGNYQIKHGDHKSPEYTAWCHIKNRCTDPGFKQWHLYGGRGITICDEWLNDYEAFLAYVGRRPSLKHSIDRYPNNDGNYEPGNVRWATDREQCRNKRTNRLIAYQGKTLCLKDWAKEFGVSYQYLQYRLKIGSFPGPKVKSQETPL